MRFKNGSTPPVYRLAAVISAILITVLSFCAFNSISNSMSHAEEEGIEHFAYEISNEPISPSNTSEIQIAADTATTYTGQWAPGTITNGNQVNITPKIDVQIQYAPGAKTMTVSYRRASISVIGTQSTLGNFYDGFCLCIPPSPTRIPAGTGATGPAPAGNKDTLANAIKDFNTYAKTSGGLAWYVVQRNQNNTEWTQGGTLSDGAWHTYTYDLTGYKAGDSPILLYYGNRHWPTTGSEVYTYNILYASTLGMNVKVAPKVQSQASAGGTISYSGEKYYEYGTTTDTYTWTPAKGYRTSKVIIDGKEISNPTNTSSWSFTNITADHSIQVEFERIVSVLTYDKNAPMSDSDQTVSERYESGQNASIIDNPYIYPGHAFTGWNTEPDGSGVSYLPQGTIFVDDQDITLYAQWEEIRRHVTWVDAHDNKSIIYEEDVLDTYPATKIEPPQHVGYALNEATYPSDEELSSITEDKTFMLKYDSIPYSVQVEYLNIHSMRPIKDNERHELLYEQSLDIPTFISAKYRFEPGEVKVVDTDSGEQIDSSTVISYIYDTDNEEASIPSSIAIPTMPARNLTITLCYDTWIQMPETGESGLTLIWIPAAGLIIVGLIGIIVRKNKRR